MIQNTPEWLEARAGKITASRMSDVLAYDPGGGVFKSGPRKGQEKTAKSLQCRLDYIGDMIAELLTGQPKDQIRAKAMDWGHDVEAAARAAYEAETGEIVELAGFVVHPLIPYVGCSPDGLVGSVGMAQIKCPANPANHIATIRDGMPDEHIPQVQTEMWVTGRQWNDFISYDPRMPENLRLYVQRIPRDDEYIATLQTACAQMWREVQELLAILENRSEAA